MFKIKNKQLGNQLIKYNIYFIQFYEYYYLF